MSHRKNTSWQHKAKNNLQSSTTVPKRVLYYRLHVLHGVTRNALIMSWPKSILQILAITQAFSLNKSYTYTISLLRYYDCGSHSTIVTVYMIWLHLANSNSFNMCTKQAPFDSHAETKTYLDFDIFNVNTAQDKYLWLFDHHQSASQKLIAAARAARCLPACLACLLALTDCYNMWHNYMTMDSYQLQVGCLCNWLSLFLGSEQWILKKCMKVWWKHLYFSFKEKG